MVFESGLTVVHHDQLARRIGLKMQDTVNYQKMVKLRTATGDPISFHEYRDVQLKGSDGQEVEVKSAVAKVAHTIVSVAALSDKGISVVFSPDRMRHHT